MRARAPLMILALLSMGAYAGEDPATKADPALRNASVAFEALDRNADLQISKTEAAADQTLSDNFASADANGDGYLSKSEYLSRHKG